MRKNLLPSPSTQTACLVDIALAYQHWAECSNDTLHQYWLNIVGLTREADHHRRRRGQEGIGVCG